MPVEKKPKKEIVKRAPKTVKEKTAIAMKIAEPTRSMTNIVEEVYNPTTKSSATSIASKLLTKVDMTSYFEEAGLTNEVLAQNVTRIAITAKKRDHFSGEYDDDYLAQLKAMEFAAKLMGMLQTSKELGEDANNFDVQIVTYNDNRTVQL